MSHDDRHDSGVGGTDSPPSYQEAMARDSRIVAAISYRSSSAAHYFDMPNPKSKRNPPNRPLGPFGRTGRRSVRPVQPDLNHGLDPRRRVVVCRGGCGCLDLLLSLFGP